MSPSLLARILQTIIAYMMISLVGSAVEAVSSQLASDHVKLLESTIAELEQCKALSQRLQADLETESWETVVSLRWQLETTRRDLELVLNRPLLEIAVARIFTWVKSRIGETQSNLENLEALITNVDVSSLYTSGRVYVQSLVPKVDVSGIYASGWLYVQRVTLSGMQYAWHLISQLTLWKVQAEKDFVIYLNKNLSKDFLPYADQLVAIVFVGFPAFILAIIWHTATSKIYSVLGRLLFRGKADEIFNNADDAAQQERPTRLGREAAPVMRTVMSRGAQAYEASNHGPDDDDDDYEFDDRE